MGNLLRFEDLASRHPHQKRQMQLFKTYFHTHFPVPWDVIFATLRFHFWSHCRPFPSPLSLKQAISHHLLLLFTSKRGKAHLQLLKVSQHGLGIKLPSYKLAYFYSFFHVRIVKNFNKQFYLKWLIEPSSLVRCRCSSHSCCRLAEQLRGNYFSSLCFGSLFIKLITIIPFSDLL